MPLLILAIASLGGAVFYLTEIVTAPARERRNLVTRAAHYGRMRVIHGRELPRFRERALAPVVQRLAHLTLRGNPRMSAASGGREPAAPRTAPPSPPALLPARASS